MKELALRTTQNVVIEYPAAKPFERIVAMVLDLLILAIIAWLMIDAIVGLLDFFNVDGVGYNMLAFLPLFVLMAYHILSEYFANGQTLGKKAMGIRVVRLDGQRAGLRESLIRSILLMIDLVFSLGVLGTLLMATSRRNQRLGDMAANTVVIKSKPPKQFRLEDIAKIQSMDDYEPTYPQVISFTEKDVLTVKNILGRYKKYKNKAHQEAFSQLVEKLGEMLDLEELPRNKIKFVETIIRDYIVLTR